MAQEFLNDGQILITKKAYEEGREAFARGLALASNPRYLSVLRREWDRGWEDAKEESKRALKDEVANDEVV